MSEERHVTAAELAGTPGWPGTERGVAKRAEALGLPKRM